ncbi:MAG: DMT family transporter, partial [Bacillota bacterium]
LSAAVASFEGWRGEGFDPLVAGTLLLTGPLVSGVFLVLQVWGQRHTSATHAAVIFSLEPVFAGLAGWMFAGEVFRARAMLGGALILAGMLVAEVPRLRVEPKASVRRRIWGTHVP